MKTLVLCGGSGTRLWPLSRSLYPKQFYPLFKDHSLYQKTLLRNAPHTDEFLIVINEEQYFMGLDQYEALKLNIPVRFILEPVGRNTAPAIALAAFSVHPTDTLLVVPSDQLIEEQSLLNQSVAEAKILIEKNQLVTFGIKPTAPNTGYGYIESQGTRVLSFKEKPDVETAKKYISSGNYYWNSGMFAFKAMVFLSELEVHHPAIYQATKNLITNTPKAGPQRFKKEEMMMIPSDSIDYAVMEKSKNVSVVSTTFTWSDLGSFDSLYESLEKDKDGNTLSSQTIHLGSKNNLIFSSDRQIALIDVDHLMVVDTPDALLIARQGSGQKVKNIVDELKKTKNELTHVHTTAHRPWGSYTVLKDAEDFKVKRIVVKPGSRISLQKHAKRSEHWIVVRGTATVTIDDKTFELERNQSTYIPLGAVHRLENKTQAEVVLIEAQVGDYLGEDDIIRLQDDYKRN